MRYLRFVLFLALLGLSAAALTGGAVSAQNAEDPQQSCEDTHAPGQYWAGVCKPVPLAEGTLNSLNLDSEELAKLLPLPASERYQRFQPYLVNFAEAANDNPTQEVGATQRIPNTEYMIVVVKRGCFALDVGEQNNPDAGQFNSVVVATPRGELQRLEPTEDGEVTAFEVPEGSAPPGCRFTTAGTASPDGSATPAGIETYSCPISCVIDPNAPVLLEEGDVAFAKKGVICLWCLIHAHAGEADVAGSLEVLALLESDDLNSLDSAEFINSFSWIESWEEPPEVATPPSARSGASAIRAFLFNPQSSRCHGS